MNRCINKICVPISSIFYALFAVKTVIFLLFSFLQCPGYDFLFFMLYQNEYYTHYFAFQVITSFISSRFGMDYKIIAIIVLLCQLLYLCHSHCLCRFLLIWFFSLPSIMAIIEVLFCLFFGFYYLRAIYLGGGDLFI